MKYFKFIRKLLPHKKVSLTDSSRKGDNGIDDEWIYKMYLLIKIMNLYNSLDRFP